MSNVLEKLRKEIVISYMRSLGLSQEVADMYRKGVILKTASGLGHYNVFKDEDSVNYPFLVIEGDIQRCNFIFWFEDVWTAFTKESFIRKVCNLPDEGVLDNSNPLFYLAIQQMDYFGKLLFTDYAEVEQISRKDVIKLQHIADFLSYLNGNLPNSLEDKEIESSYKKIINNMDAKEADSIAKTWQGIIRELFFSETAFFKDEEYEKVIAYVIDMGTSKVIYSSCKPVALVKKMREGSKTNGFRHLKLILGGKYRNS